MSQPVFKQKLEEDLVQRVGTKLTLEVIVEETSEKVFFEWRGPSGSTVDDGRVVITESGTTSTAEITPLHQQVASFLCYIFLISNNTYCDALSKLDNFICLYIENSEYFRTKECGHVQLKINMASLRQNVMSSPKVCI